MRGDVSAAAERFEHAFALGCQLGDPCWEGIAGRGLGRVAVARGETQRAVEILVDSIARCVRLPDAYLWGKGYALDVLCGVAAAHAMPQASAWIDELQNLSARCGMRELSVRSYLHRAALGDSASSGRGAAARAARSTTRRCTPWSSCRTHSPRLRSAAPAQEIDDMMKVRSKRAALRGGTQCLPCGQAVRLGRLGGELTVIDGRIWLTRNHDPGDHFIESGQRVRLGVGENAVIECVAGEQRRAAALEPASPWLYRRLAGRDLARCRLPGRPGRARVRGASAQRRSGREPRTRWLRRARFRHGAASSP